MLTNVKVINTAPHPFSDQEVTEDEGSSELGEVQVKEGSYGPLSLREWNSRQFPESVIGQEIPSVKSDRDKESRESEVLESERASEKRVKSSQPRLLSKVL